MLESKGKTMYESILIPTDGSKPADRAAEHGFKLAEQFGSTVHILHITELGDSATAAPYGGIGVSVVTEKAVSNINERATEIVEQLETKANKAGVSTIVEIRQGSARQDIIRYANEQDIELIVMGTHGRSGIERFLFGSVTERTVRTTDIPIFVI